MKDLTVLLGKIFITIFFTALVVLSFWDKPNTIALNYISAVFEQSSSSLLLLSELKIVAASGASVKIPLVSGSFSGVESMLNEGMQYLEFANLLLGLQLIALTLSKSIILKVLILLAIVFVFFERSKVLALRVLVVFLLINPGLAIYTIGLEAISKEVQIDLGSNLNAELKLAHENYLAKKKNHESKLDAQKKKQLEVAQSKGKNHISLFNRAKDTVESTVYHTEDDVSLAFNDTILVLKAAGQKIIGLCLNLFTHVLFLFLILPFGYYYMMRYLLKDLFQSLPTNLKNQTKNEN